MPTPPRPDPSHLPSSPAADGEALSSTVWFLELAPPPDAPRRAPVVLCDRGAGWEVRFPLRAEEMLCWEDLTDGLAGYKRLPVLGDPTVTRWAVALPLARDLIEALLQAECVSSISALALQPEGRLVEATPLTASIGA